VAKGRLSVMDITRTMQITMKLNVQDLLDDIFNEMTLKEVYKSWTSEAEKEDLKEFLNGE